MRLVQPWGQADPHILVGNDTHDDAGVYQLDDHTALVQTVDFFTPIVDDPALYGEIAAVNALSDIYAMGARPLTALNLLAVPGGIMPPETIAAMLNAGARVLTQSQCALLGGHSIDDPEPKFGYAITGLVHPEHIWKNSTARVGDWLYLTKPIGTGVVIKAIKDGSVSPEALDEAIDTMRLLNRSAYELLCDVGGPTACTDVTGFGLLGHLLEMAEGAGVRFHVAATRVPHIPGALTLAEQDGFPAGSRRNLEYVRPFIHAPEVPVPVVGLLADAVTSGGLLFTVPAQLGPQLESMAASRSIPLFRIGEAILGPMGIDVEP